jgi:uncharacterized membrane protein
MPAWFWVLFWWLLFGGTHIGLSARGVRQSLVARLGPRGFQAVYSVISLATFVPLVRAYFGHRHAGPLLWNLGAAAVPWGLAMVLASVGMACLVASFLQPSPVGIAPVKAEARGMMRITRHPLFCAFALWGLGHAIVNGYLGDVLFFGGFVVFSLVGALHQDARKRRDEGERLAEFYAQTSVLPFGAILAGRNRLVVEEVPWLGLLIGLVAAVAIYLLHPRLFGV